MSEIINADFRVVQERTPEVICTEIKTIETQTCGFVIGGAIEIGRRLTELKAMVGHGNWLEYCEKNLEYKEKQVQRFIKISNTYGDENSPFSNPSILSDLSISKAYSLLAVPEDEVEEFTEQNDIGSMKVSELEAEIKSWKTKTEGLSAELDKSKEQNQELQKAVEESESRHKELLKDLDELKNSEVDPEELEQLKAQLEREQQKADKAKADLAKEKAKLQDEINKAVGEKAEELQKAVEEKHQIEIQRIERQKKLAEDKVQELAKKLEQSSSEEVTKFKLKAEELQLTFRDIKEVIHKVQKQDPEQAEKMRCAMRNVLDKFEEGIK